ncbi:aminodeoxychorismate synthase component I [Streptomyces samsunensis]|uniref:aminodeoxychorismate synthase component I n=1 Tax=Streptomyces malaysiensis TaxID=92644 RepID=UPI001582B12B|nr:aminodeoxychorismate synthase component I [Streptomyces samsunensis]NUH37499.1 aminodeoxychorismate synthase component I [Streptomyces samsunensis]
MRTLLVDNYDSFTYNLFHYLAEVNGEEPEVIRHDDPGWKPEMLRDFDNVVISPGPGSPERAADFGVCRDIILEGALPLLGVCLGHQGVGLLSGARVVLAPEPRHGRLSRVTHDGTGLFTGLPDPFDVVRYHSLTVTDLPGELRATAWTEDGVLMGIAHRERPLWGVQFHPESICTEHGRLLLGNFADLTRSWRTAHGVEPVRRRGPRSARGGTEPTAARRGTPRSLRVLVESLPTRWSDEVVHDRLFRADPNAFWLDSSAVGGERGRFSMMGDASGPLARVATADTWAGTVTVTAGGSREVLHEEFLSWLERDLRGARVELPPLPFDFALGWTGYLGYELKAECGGERTHRSSEPDAAMIFADRAVVFDHETSTTYLLALAEDGVAGGGEEQAREWLRETAGRLAELAGQEPRHPAPLATGSAEVRLRHDRERYLEMIDTCQELITAGETYEVCLTNMAEADGPVDPWAGYQYLRRLSPAPFAALLRFGPLSVLSTSPERFLRVFRDGTVESQPIKGTRPRGSSPAEDELLRVDLATSEKDRSENLMIVDLVRNDLGRTAEIGSVRVPKIFDVETYATVHQLVSTVRATLRPTGSAVESVRAAFPGGSMTGAPKIRTMQIIDDLEAGPRGVYSGAIGYFSLSGACDLSIVIRTLVVTPDRVRYGVGGAIVALSDPDEEFEETAVKATPLLRLLGAEFPGRVGTQFPDRVGPETAAAH